MIEGDKLSAAATICAVGMLVAVWLCRDTIIAVLTAPKRGKEHTRLRWLKMRGMEDYVGRHRVELLA